MVLQQAWAVLSKGKSASTHLHLLACHILLSLQVNKDQCLIS